MNISKKFVIPVAFLCGGLIVFFGMQMFFMSRPHAPFGFPPANVSVVKVIKENLPFSVQYPAKVAAYQETQIKALVSGNLIDSPYEAGDYVKEGALLFEIDPTLYQQAFNKAKANYQKAKSNLWQIERTFKRVEKLYKTKSVSLEDFDKAKSAYQMALAGVNIAKAEFDTANTQLGYTKVRAPYDGIVSKGVLSNGDFISPQIGNAFLTTMVQIDKVYVNFAFPSKDYELQQKLISQGIMKFTNDKLEANVILEDGTELPNVAKVSFIDSYIDTKTQSIRARTEIDNQDKKMLPGNFVRIKLSGLEFENVYVIPDRAVMQGKKGPFVYVVEGGKAVVRPVKLGMLSEKGRVIFKGLSDGQEVIIDGMVKVRPNATVMIQQ